MNFKTRYRVWRKWKRYSSGGAMFKLRVLFGHTTPSFLLAVYDGCDTLADILDEFAKPAIPRGDGKSTMRLAEILDVAPEDLTRILNIPVCGEDVADG